MRNATSAQSANPLRVALGVQFVATALMAGGLKATIPTTHESEIASQRYQCPERSLLRYC